MHSNRVETRLAVFSDDWGRHPSSSQHLMQRLQDRYPILWVNTIGMRPPRWSWDDARKVLLKLRQWSSFSAPTEMRATNISVISPPMYPSFRMGWQRQLNAWLLTAAVRRALGPRQDHQRRIAITTLPITADLVGRLPVDRWVYYCVDDFSAWPGLDGQVMDTMEFQQLQAVDVILSASEPLRERVLRMGRQAALVTHGVDVEHWSVGAPPSSMDWQKLDHSATARAGQGTDADQTRLPDWWARLGGRIILFWGLIDQRLDVDWCRTLMAGSIESVALVLVGPHQVVDPRLRALPQVFMPGPLPYDVLPRAAAAADVLVMPYADLPVTRAMQPLKFKEYLATGKPVVVRALPATREWADAADVVETADEFVAAVRERLRSGVPASQLEARRRLIDESWAHKTRQFEALMLAGL